MAGGYGALVPRVIGGMALYWLLTMPVGAVLAAIVFHLLRAALG